MVKPVNRGKGRWMITVCCGYESGRKQLIRRTIHLDPRMTETAQRREAEKQTALLLAQYETGRLNSDSSLTLEQFAALWFRDYADRRGLSEKTKHHYMFLLTSRILPYLGRVKLRDIRPRTLHQFYARLDQDELSGATKHKYHTLLHNMLGAAVRWQILPFNPADSVEAPRRDTKEITPYTDEQAAAMLACLHTEPVQWQAYVLLALYGQLRRGEMVALDWDDVDLLSSVITIRQAAAYVPGQGVALKRPKTASGTRTIAVPTNVYTWPCAAGGPYKTLIGCAWQRIGRATRSLPNGTGRGCTRIPPPDGLPSSCSAMASRISVCMTSGTPALPCSLRAAWT